MGYDSEPLVLQCDNSLLPPKIGPSHLFSRCPENPVDQPRVPLFQPQDLLPKASLACRNIYIMCYIIINH